MKRSEASEKYLSYIYLTYSAPGETPAVESCYHTTERPAPELSGTELVISYEAPHTMTGLDNLAIAATAFPYPKNIILVDEIDQQKKILTSAIEIHEQIVLHDHKWNSDLNTYSVPSVHQVVSVISMLLTTAKEKTSSGSVHAGGISVTNEGIISYQFDDEKGGFHANGHI